MRSSIGLVALLLLVWMPSVRAQVPPTAFVNYEIAPIHAMDMSPDGDYLASANTADMRIEIYALSSGTPSLHAVISVGLEPVSVRFRTNQELWVVNNLSDSVSIIDVNQKRVTATLKTKDDPQDIVFAGSPERAFVSCGFPHILQLFDPANLSAPATEVTLQGNNPRALARSPDGSKVYAAFFHSGNRTTILSGGMSAPGSTIVNFPPDAVRVISGPHGGVFQPGNVGSGIFNPPRNIAAGTPPNVSMIVRQDAGGVWRDDTGANWSPLIDGANASQSGRYPGWKLLDHDVAVVNTSSLSVSYISDMMNICMAVDVNPASGQVTVVGTEAHNDIRFEPVINATFIDVMAAFGNPDTLQTTSRVDVNASLVAQFSGAPLAPASRATALGDPRSIQWTSDGSVAYVAGMGSNNIVKIDSTGQRVGAVIPVQPGPVGLVLDEAREQLYVQNRFDGSISVVDLVSDTETALVNYFDPTPSVIQTGRKHLYDTQHSSAIGQIACASCHVDGRMDRLSWDLGNPAGNLDVLGARFPMNRNDSFTIPVGGVLGNQRIGTGNLTHFHPMKGPMLTQTLQDIIGHEPLHWRGDRFGIEDFNGAFHELQGRATGLTPSEMAEFKAMLATIVFPPNPFRNIDNTLPTNLPMTGHFATGRFQGSGGLPAGAPMPNGNAIAGLARYRQVDGFPIPGFGTNRLDRNVFACASCHVLPTGSSTDRRWASGAWQPIAPGPGTFGAKQLLLMGVSDVGPNTGLSNPPNASVQNTLKVPHLRNVFERTGFHMRPGTDSTHGFGFMHDGNVASVTDFLANPAFNPTSDQDLANIVALVLAWAGSDFRDSSGNLINTNATNIALLPPGVPSKDSHAGVGQQETITSPSQSLTRLNQMVAAKNSSSRVQLIAKSYSPTGNRGYLALASGSNFLADYPGEQMTLSQLVNATGNGNVVTFTLVPQGTGQRFGIDRDLDGYLDYEEVLNCTDPNDPLSFGMGSCTSVVGGFVVHNSWTGGGSGVDTVKAVHKEEGGPVTLTYDNLLNSAAGIDGIGFDIDQLANPSGLSASDFVIQVSPQGAFDELANPPGNWASGPTPASVSVTQGSPDRVILSWNSGSIVNRWLRITVKANANTGLTEEEVYYIGHLLGEVTGDTTNGRYGVTFADILPIRTIVGSTVDASSVHDIDKNGGVTFADIAAMRGNIGAQLSNITVP